MNNDFTNIMDKLNNTEPIIDFTYEQETNKTLSFLQMSYNH